MVCISTFVESMSLSTSHWLQNQFLAVEGVKAQSYIPDAPGSTKNWDLNTGLNIIMSPVLTPNCGMCRS